MTELTTYRVQFDLPLTAAQLPMFRGAIAYLAGWNNDEFHNHKAGEGLWHRYPFVQYQIHNGNAAIVAWGEGVPPLKAFVERYAGVLLLHTKPQKVALLAATEKTETLAFSETEQAYQVQRWIALSKQKHEEWLKNDRLINRVLLLQNALGSHLIAMFKGFEWRPPQRFEVTIQDFSSQTVLHRGIKYAAFEVQYSVPLLLPQDFGLGKAVSEGFGRNVRI
jgi:hypothetical protein